tara:strand:+ start:890 stop:1225 length:336 start_codon:yes stop_codon:yes gene_type:complete
MASPTFFIKQNDTTPALEVFLQDSRGRPVNLTGATVGFHMRLESDQTVKITSGSVTVESATKGHVSFAFSATNTDTAGNYEGEFQVTFAGGAVETFPNDDYIKVIITDDVV